MHKDDWARPAADRLFYHTGLHLRVCGDAMACIILPRAEILELIMGCIFSQFDLA